ncbi:MAG TPA: hypothetical protein VLI05_06020 [Candidatus Saccharimonadia bacterium]|nr:hypothetical protein [Candidatus Saccharimonadia bacterium]
MNIPTIGKKLAVALQALALMLTIGSFTIAGAAPALADCSATDLSLSNGAACAQANGTRGDLFASGGIFQTISNTLIFLVGAVAVLFLIIGGLRYVISNGDPKNVEAAKNTILYAIVGIVVAILSFAAVQFVINALNKQ